MRAPQLSSIVAASLFSNSLGLIIGCCLELSFFANAAKHVDKKR